MSNESDVKITVNAGASTPAEPEGPSCLAGLIKALITTILKYPVLLILLTLELFMHLLTCQWLSWISYNSGPGSAALRSQPIGGAEHHREANWVKTNGGKVVTPYAGVATIYDLSKRSFKVNGKSQCMGVRNFLGQKSVKVKEFGEVFWRSYAEVGVAANKFGAACKAQGMVAAPVKTDLSQLSTPCSIAIFENTCPEWMISAQGCFTQSLIVTTIYATLGMDAVVDAVQETLSRGIVCNKINVHRLLERISEMPTLKFIVYTNDMIAPDQEVDMGTAVDGITVMSFDDFIESGDCSKFPPTPPAPESCAVIMYTSGSTGKPKGVVVTHSNLLSTVGGALISLGAKNSDVYLGYLPLAHILELMAEFGMLGCGATICYADPKTLTQTGAYPIGALEQYSPTIMAGVPKIWDVIKKGVQAKIGLAPPISQFLFAWAFSVRSFAMARGFDTPVFAKIVFKKFSLVVGGRLRLAMSGGGPLNTEVQIFVRTCFGCPLFQGYGLTETCAGLTIQDPADLRCGIAGVPLSCCEAKLESCPDIADKNKKPYLIEDRFDVVGNPILGRGEVLTKGNNVTVGYYMMPEKTAEEYEESGFFHTGDIGQFMADGSIRIVDRKKNLLKLKGGEYIAIENMEMCYGNSKFVDAVNGGICCYGDGDMDRPVALMQLNEPIVKAWSRSNGYQGDFMELKENPDLMKAVLADLQNEGKKAGLSNLEKLAAVVFLTDPWTPDNGCLTAANKLQRRIVVETFAKEFEEVRKKGIF